MCMGSLWTFGSHDVIYDLFNFLSDLAVLGQHGIWPSSR
jgi:hypothetical protein